MKDRYETPVSDPLFARRIAEFLGVLSARKAVEAVAPSESPSERIALLAIDKLIAEFRLRLQTDSLQIVFGAPEGEAKPGMLNDLGETEIVSKPDGSFAIAWSFRNVR